MKSEWRLRWQAQRKDDNDKREGGGRLGGKVLKASSLPSYNVSAGPTRRSSHSKTLSSTKPTETPSGGFLLSSVV